MSLIIHVKFREHSSLLSRFFPRMICFAVYVLVNVNVFAISLFCLMMSVPVMPYHVMVYVSIVMDVYVNAHLVMYFLWRREEMTRLHEMTFFVFLSTGCRQFEMLWVNCHPNPPPPSFLFDLPFIQNNCLCYVNSAE